MSARLEPDQRALLEEARRATLATIGPDGLPRLFPCCFALLDRPDGPLLVTPIDEKPKRTSDPRTLARVTDIERDGRVTLLVDRWDEDWSRLAWLRVTGTADVLWPSDAREAHAEAAVALRHRYRQYRAHILESLPMIRITPTRISGWEAVRSS